MQAVILAGGEGRRLRPYTTVLPKPLMPINERPILELIVAQLREAGFAELTLAVGYLAGLIESYFGNGERFGVSIVYSLEDKPLGTAGPLSLIVRPTSDFLVLNGDIVTDLSFGGMMASHQANGVIATVAVYQKLVPISLGVLELDDSDAITNYIEKPTLTYAVSTGVYCFHPRVIDHLEAGQRCDLPDLILRLLACGERVQGYRFHGQWLDIGRPEDYEAAHDLFER